jgi:hypothetical protein
MAQDDKKVVLFKDAAANKYIGVSANGEIAEY